MSNKEIATLLRERDSIKNRTKDIRLELIKIIIEDSILTQDEAMKIDVFTFMDGYLAGKGCIQNFRKDELQK